MYADAFLNSLVFYFFHYDNSHTSLPLVYISSWYNLTPFNSQEFKKNKPKQNPPKHPRTIKVSVHYVFIFLILSLLSIHIDLKRLFLSGHGK